RHRSLACRPNAPRSRTTTSRRSWGWARTPHTAHQSRSVLVSTSNSSSPSVLVDPTPRNSDSPSMTTSAGLPSTLTEPVTTSRSTLRDEDPFISYAWTSDQHRQWVRLLASQLKAIGYDVLVDPDVDYGDELNGFMRRVTEARHVLMSW